MIQSLRKSWLLTTLLLVATMVLPASVWAQSVVTEQPAAGTGSSADPYRIANAAQLAWFRDWVNGTYTPADSETATKHENACAKLIADINMSTVCSESIGSWQFISPFQDGVRWSGTFDGDGHTISNLYINSTARFTGMFGCSSSGIIQNITFTNVNITGQENFTGLVGIGMNCTVRNVTVASGTISGKYFVGSICGKMLGGPGVISHCINHAQVTATEYGAGGICADAIGDIEYCTNYGKVLSKGAYAGGIASNQTSNNNVTHCANHGEVEGNDYVGGITGWHNGSGSISNVISTGNIIETSNSQTCGMVVGQVNATLTLSDYAIFSSDASMTCQGTPLTPRGIGSANNLNDITGKTVGYTTVQIESGMATYLLQTAAPEGTWGQQLGTDTYPRLGSSHTVYAEGSITIACTGDMSDGNFTNTRPATEATVTFNHGTATHHDAVAGTCTTDGNVEYWECDLCHLFFTDEALTTDIADPVLHATGHNYDYASGSCTTCGENIPTVKKGTNTIQIAAVTKQNTVINGYNLFRFVAPVDGEITVQTVGSDNTYGSLWSGDGTTQLASDNSSGDGNNFKFTIAVTKGTVYYIGVRQYSGYAISGDYALTITVTAYDDGAKPQGDGTSANPYQITNAAQLAWFRNWVNGTYTPDEDETATSHADACAKLTADIDMAPVCSGSVGSWIPISSQSKNVNWSGTFDGDGHTISNLYVNTTATHFGMFGKTGNCTIKNITFSGVSIYGGEAYTGIVAFLNGSATNVTVADGTITGKNHVGSICGGLGSTGTVTLCINHAQVIATSNHAGGIVGAQEGGCISRCDNRGNVTAAACVGGIVGSVSAAGSISDVISTGNVTETGNSGFAGFVVGDVRAALTLPDHAMFRSDATLTSGGTTLTAQGIGRIDSANGGTVIGKTTGYTTTQLQSGMATYLLQTAVPEGTWGQQLGTDDYPQLGSDQKVYAEGEIIIDCQNGMTGGSFTNTRPDKEGTVTLGHGESIHYSAQEKTCVVDGNVEYWKCGLCRRYFTDAAMTNEIADPVLYSTGHAYHYDLDHCTICGQVFPTLEDGEKNYLLDATSRELSDINSYTLFRIVAPANGEITVESLGWTYDTYATLWSGDGTTLLVNNDDGGEEKNFKITYTVTKGTVYFFGMRDYFGKIIQRQPVVFRANWYEKDVKPAGDGTPENPYLISYSGQLAWFRDWVNGTYTPADGETATKHEDACAKLTADIDMNFVCNETNGSWQPISRADLNVLWSGTFDGDGHTISNLYVNSSADHFGMFGQTGNCQIKNITFTATSITGRFDHAGIIGTLSGSATNVTVADGSISGMNDVGGICGSLSNGGKVSHCTNRAELLAVRNHGGGICGNSSGIVEFCSNFAAVESYRLGAGGIVGQQNGGSISHCANHGTVEGGVADAGNVGGIVGLVTGAVSISNVISTGNVTKKNNDETAGLLVGNVQAELTLSDHAVFRSDATLSIGETAQTARAIGLIDTANGGNLSGRPQGFTTAQLQSGMVTCLLQTAVPEATWGQQLGTDTYPQLGSAHLVYAQGDITIECTGEMIGGTLTNTQPETEGTVTVATLIHHDAVEKTCTTDGNVEYWECSYCHRFYTDTDLSAEIADPVLHAVGHTYDFIDGSCTVCGETIPVLEAGTHTIQIAAVFNDNTATNGYNLYRFEAPSNGEITVEATGSDDTYGALWSGDGTTKLTEDDNSSSNKKDFKFKYPVTNGTVYYLGVRKSSGEAISGDCALTINFMSIDGDGSSETPFLLANAAQLAWFRDWVNGTYTPANGETTQKHKTACAKLIDDIDMSSVCSKTVGNWISISPSLGSVNWEGTFDGDGHTISNLYVNSTYQNSGMFDQTGNCCIKNITFTGVNITGDMFTGLVRNLYGTVKNVTVADGTITGKEYVGSICASSDGIIENCTNYATVKSTGYCVGGITGTQKGGHISNCANHGNVEANYHVGGIVGAIYGEATNLSNVISTGNVTERVVTGTNGLLVGVVQGGLVFSECMVFRSDAILKSLATELEARAIGYVDESENGNVTGEAVGYDTTHFRSGMVTYLLQTAAPEGTWGQQLGTDTYPQLGSAHLVYAQGDITIECTGEMIGGTLTNTQPETEGTVTVATLIHHDAVEKTCTTDGNVEYWECSYCHRFYTDTDLSAEIADPVLHAVGHTYDFIDGSCTVCGETIPVLEAGTHTIQIAAVFNDNTATNGYNLYRFEAPSNGEITVEATGSDDTYGALWSGDGTTKLTEDDNSSSNKKDFKFKYPVTNGTVYYLGVRKSSGEAISGDCALTINFMSIDGDGSSETPFLLANAAQLAWFRDWVNGTYTPANGETTQKHKTACAKLIDDIDMSSVCSKTVGNWISISPSLGSVNWEGTFDGDGHTISNLYVNSTYQNSGMFDQTGNCCIKNITFTGVNITGDMFTGLVRNLYGTVKNVTVADGTITGKEYVGSICASSDGIIENCTNYATVKSTGYCVGGITGTQKGGHISNCANHGNVEANYHVGGIVGAIYGEATNLSNVISTGNVTERVVTGTNGLLVGVVQGGLVFSECMVFRSDAILKSLATELEARAIGYVDESENGNVTGEAVGYDTTHFRSGMVTYLLQTAAPEGTWGQQVGTDTYPQLGSVHTVYAEGAIIIDCQGGVRGGGFTNTQPETEGSVTLSHGIGIHHPAKPATCTEGNVEHWECELCHRYFSDAALTTEIKDPVIPGNGHVFDYENGVCTICGGAIPTIVTGRHDIRIGAVKEPDTYTKIEGYNVYRFVASGDGTIGVSAWGSSDTYGSLWSSDGMTLLTRNGSSFKDFEFTYTVTKGTVYYIGVRAYDGQAIDEDYSLCITASWSTEETLTLTDGEEYTTPQDVKTFTYVRNFTHTNWQPLYVPFSMSSADWKPQGLEVACINNFHEYEEADGSSKLVLEVRKVTTGTLLPNTPYLIRALEVGEKSITLTEVALQDPESKSIKCSSITRLYTFTGIYSEKSDFNADNDYTMTGGTLYHPEGALKPQRWFLTVTALDDIIKEERPNIAPWKISVSVIGEGEVTGIEDIRIVTSAPRQGIYDLQGRRLAEEPRSGIFIKDGKKLVK